MSTEFEKNKIRLNSTISGKPYVYLISLVAALGGFLFGYDMVVISGAMDYIKPYFNLTPSAQGFAVASCVAGAVVGALFAGKLADQYGRKNILIISAVLFIISAIGSGFAESLSVFNMYRILGGIGVGAASVLSPIYIAETAPTEMRGKLVSLNQLTITLGILAAYMVNFFLKGVGVEPWRWMFAAEAVPALLFFIFLFMIPESPRWLIKKNREKQALAIVTRISGPAKAAIEVAEVKASLVSETIGGFRELMKPGIKRIVLIGAFLGIFSQITGMNVILAYTTELLQTEGATTADKLRDSVWIGVVNMAFTFVAILSIDKFGRRKLLLTGLIGMTASMGAVAVALAVGFTSSLFLLICLLSFIAFFSACMGPCTWVILSEIFPNRLRGVAMSVATFCLWASNFILLFTFPILWNNLGKEQTFGIYAVICIIALLYALKYIPETKNKSLEQIEKEFLSK